MRYEALKERPPDFRLNRQHKLFRGSLFRGLGWMPGSVKMRDGDGAPGYRKSHGTLTNMDPATDWVWDNTLNRFALDFDGTNDYVAGVHSSALNAYPLTACVWFKRAAGTDYGWLIGKYFGGSLNGWGIFNLDYGAWYFGSSGSIYPWSDPPSYTIGEWVHVAFCVDSSGGTIYINGSLDSSTGWTGTPSAPTSTRAYEIGTYLADNKFSAGAESDIVVYNRALSLDEIQQLADPSDPMLSGLILPPARKLWAAVSAGPSEITGQIACLGQSATAAIAGTVAVVGSAACPGQAATVAASGAVGVAASAACAGQQATAVIATSAAVAGQIVSAGQVATAVLAGTAAVAGSIATTGQAAAAAITGAAAVAGQIACPGQQATVAAAGAVGVSGAGACPGLPAVSALLTAARIAGTLDCPGQEAAAAIAANFYVPAPPRPWHLPARAFSVALPARGSRHHLPRRPFAVTLPAEDH